MYTHTHNDTGMGAVLCMRTGVLFVLRLQCSSHSPENRQAEASQPNKGPWKITGKRW